MRSNLVIEHLQRLLHWHRDATPDAQLATLEQALQTARLPLAEVVPLVAALLSLPVPTHYPPLTLSPQRQKQQTQEALVAWLLAERAAAGARHLGRPAMGRSVNPGTASAPGASIYRAAPRAAHLSSGVSPPWPKRRVPVTQITLNRLGPSQVEAMLATLTGGKALPAALIEQIVAKTDGCRSSSKSWSK